MARILLVWLLVLLALLIPLRVLAKDCGCQLGSKCYWQCQEHCSNVQPELNEKLLKDFEECEREDAAHRGCDTSPWPPRTSCPIGEKK